METMLLLLGAPGLQAAGAGVRPSWAGPLVWSTLAADTALALAFGAATVAAMRRRVGEPGPRALQALLPVLLACAALLHALAALSLWLDHGALLALARTGAAVVVAGIAARLVSTWWRTGPGRAAGPAQACAPADEAGRLAAIVESSYDAIIGKDLQGIITSWNPGAQSLFGYAAEEAIGRPMQMLIPAERSEEEPRILARIARGERVPSFDTVRRRKDGSLVDISTTISALRDARGRVVGAASIAHDITQRKRVEAAMQLAQTRLRQVIEAAPSGILMVDASGLIVMANRHAADLFAYEERDLVGAAIEQLVPEARRGPHREHVRQFLARPTARPMGQGETLFGRRQDGSSVPVEIGLNPLVTDEGRFTLASVTDLTERHRQEDELRRSNAELEQFAYVASHDLQEPLRMVVSFCELLQLRYQGRLDERADKYIHYAVDGARRMQQLVADLLAYSRVGSQGGPMQATDVQALLERVMQLLAPSLRDAGAEVDARDLPTVLADEGQLTQLFQNLLSNAVKFRGEAPLVVSVRARLQARRWHFEVQDNGIGFEMQYAERIFQMFQRLHERSRYPGSGIGLAIVKRIVQRHGGDIEVRSEPGQGTTFFFSLPSA